MCVCVCVYQCVQWWYVPVVVFANDSRGRRQSASIQMPHGCDSSSFRIVLAASRGYLDIER